MHEVINEVYLQKFLGMGVTFRDESSDGNYLMICYSDHSLIIR